MSKGFWWVLRFISEFKCQEYRLESMGGTDVWDSWLQIPVGVTRTPNTAGIESE